MIAVIPARGSSKGLPRKNLRPLAGTPLVVHTIRAAQASRLLRDFVVSTDDDEIAAAARAAGAPVPFVRPAELARDETTAWPVVRHAIDDWEGRNGQHAEAAVLLQPTSPLRTGADIDDCIDRFRALKADIAATATRAHDSPHFNMLEVTPDSAPFARACSPLMLKHLRRQEAPPVYALNGAVFVVRREVLAALDNQFTIERFVVSEMPRERSVDIDTADDLALAEWYLSRRAEGR